MQAVADQDLDLEEYLLHSGVVHRERGTLGGIMSVLECGGPAEGGNLDTAGAYVHPFTDRQLGTGKVIVGDIERHRWLAAAWFGCSEGSRHLLQLRHTAPRAEARSDAGYGARDRYVEGSDHREGELGLTRTGTDTYLGALAALALQLSPHPDKLLIACHDPNPLHRGGKRDGTINRDESARRGKIIREAKRLAEEAMAPAWAEWFESKAGADPARRNSERRAALPAHVAAVAAE